jgi:eukaryotic-like serine/threonine-protein kinase
MPEPAKYRVLHELGVGGMGRIHKGELIGHAGFSRPIVIKRLRHAEDPNHVRLFVEEARRYATLDHENIGRIFDFEQLDDQLWIIMEYIDGWSLVDFIERHKQLGRFPHVELSVFIASRVCRALQYVYEKAAIVHRDVSPSNIMMTREGTVKLIDFGIATRSGTRDSSLTGKPAYMAPEMVSELRADHRSDVFSLGAVLFESLTRERLFPGLTTPQVLEQVVAGEIRSPKTLRPEVPDDVVTILAKATRRNPERRFASAGEMGEACEHFLYDKGYGPTNLTLKQYVSALFPEEGRVAAPLESPTAFPVIEPTLIPIGESADTDLTRPSQPRSKTVETPAPAPGPAPAPDTLPPQPGRPPEDRSGPVR